MKLSEWVMHGVEDRAEALRGTEVCLACGQGRHYGAIWIGLGGQIVLCRECIAGIVGTMLGDAIADSCGMNLPAVYAEMADGQTERVEKSMWRSLFAHACRELERERDEDGEEKVRTGKLWLETVETE